MRCHRCGSSSLSGPMATGLGDPVYPGRIIRCRGCWSDFTAYTPEVGANQSETQHARNDAAKAAYRKAKSEDMVPIPGM